MEGQGLIRIRSEKFKDGAPRAPSLVGVLSQIAFNCSARVGSNVGSSVVFYKSAVQLLSNKERERCYVLAFG